MNFFKSYFDNLAGHPERADLLLLWTLSVGFIWFWMIRFRMKSIEGMEKEGTSQGETPSWETREQIIFWMLFMTPPILFYLLYFTDTFKIYVFGIIAGILGYQIFGRFIFDWVLAFKGGLSEVPEHEKDKETKVKVETKVETSQQ